MSKHTPGPWAIESGGDIIQDAEPCFPLVAHCFDTPGFADGEAEANARLMAAAPDLLAALRQLTRFCVRPGDDRHDYGYDEGMRQARAAIAKAEAGKPL